MEKDINKDGVPLKEGNEVCGLGMLAALFGAEKAIRLLKNAWTSLVRVILLVRMVDFSWI